MSNIKSPSKHIDTTDLEWPLDEARRAIANALLWNDGRWGDDMSAEARREGMRKVLYEALAKLECAHINVKNLNKEHDARVAYEAAQSKH